MDVQHTIVSQGIGNSGFFLEGGGLIPDRQTPRPGSVRGPKARSRPGSARV